MTPDIIRKATMTPAAAAVAATATTITTTMPNISKAIHTVSAVSSTKKLSTTIARTTTATNLSTASQLSASSSSLTPTATTSSAKSIVQRHRLTIEKLQHRVHQILKCVINLHIDILVLESNVNQLLDEVKEFNADLLEVKRLDDLIETLRDYSGPTIYHEWPFPLVCQATIDEADLAQSLNTNELLTS